MPESFALVKTISLKLKNVSSSDRTFLHQGRYEVNQVWNYINDLQRRYFHQNLQFKGFGPHCFLSSMDINRFMTGDTAYDERENPYGNKVINNAVCQRIGKEYATRRKQAHKRWLRFRKSYDQGVLGWIPFKDENLKIKHQEIQIAGRHKKPFVIEALLHQGYRAFPKKFPMTIRVLNRYWKVHNERYLAFHLFALQGRVVSGNFAQDSLGDWFLNLQIEFESDTYQKHLEQDKGIPLVPEKEVVGIDLGLDRLATLSKSLDKRQTHIIEKQTFYRKQQKKLAYLQSTCKKKQFKRLHQKIRNQRDQFIHSLSLDFIREFLVIKFGDLSIKNLSRKRKNQRGLGKSFHDHALGQLIAITSYKSHGAGRFCGRVDERHSTQTCSHCGSLTGPKGQQGLHVRQWCCSVCGTEHDRDQNSSFIIEQRPLEKSSSSRLRVKPLIAEMEIS
jgi:putative transposase